MNSPRHNATHQHISTTNNQQQTTNNWNQQQRQQQTRTLLPTPQQQPSTTNNKCTVTRTATTPATATTNNSGNCSIKLRPRTHFLPHRCTRLCPEKAKGSSNNNSCNRKERHMASNSMENLSQCQATRDLQSRFLVQRSKTHRRRAQTAVTHQQQRFFVEVVFELCGFLQFSNVLFVNVFSGVHCSSQEHESE